MFAPHIILFLFICKKEVFQITTIVNNFTSFVKKHKTSLVDVSNIFYRGKDLASRKQRNYFASWKVM